MVCTLITSPLLNPYASGNKMILKKSLKFYCWLLCCFFLCAGCGLPGESNVTGNPMRVKAILKQSNELIKSGNKADALVLLKASLSSQGEKFNSLDRYRLLDRIRQYYYEDVINNSAALAYSDSCFKVLKEFGTQSTYSLLIAEANLNRADILFRLQRYNEAYSAFYKANLQIKKSGDPCQHVMLLFNFHSRLANVSYGQNQFLSAVKQQKNAISVLTQCNFGSEQAYLIQGAYDNIALAYMQMESPDSALFYYSKALAVVGGNHRGAADSNKDFEIARGVVLGNMGTAERKKGNMQAAENYFKASIAINGRPGYANQDALITRMKLAELFLDAGQTAKADPLIHQIHTAKDTLPEPQDKLQLLLLDAAYAKASGQYQSATALLQQYVVEQRQLRRKQLKLLNTDYGKEFELLERRYDMQVLEKKNQLQTALLVTASIVCLLVAVLLIIFYRSRQTTRKHVQQSRAHNQQLEIALEALEDSVKENGRVMRVLAHDLKNPLGAIYGMSILMLDEPGVDDDTREMLQAVKTSSENMNTIIHDLLTAKITRETQPESTEAAELTTLISESVTLLQYRAREKQQQIIFDTAASFYVQIDKQKIWRVVNNLIVNAIKFSPAHSKIFVQLSELAGDVIITVKDSGIGIPPEFQEKIFDLSTETRRKGTAGEESYGLGLFTSRQIVNDLGGKLWFESEVGKGSFFYLSLPLIK